MLIGCKNLKTSHLLLPHLKVPRGVLPATQSLIATIHFQFAVPTVFRPPKPTLPQRLPMQNSLYPMMNGKFRNVSSQFPTRTTANTEQLCIFAMPTKCAARSFQVCKTSCHSSVQSMCRGGPTMDRQNLRK